jgi:hypothetical protein
MGAHFSLSSSVLSEAIPIMRVPDTGFLMNIASSKRPETFLLRLELLGYALFKIFVGVQLDMGAGFLEEVGVLFLDVDSGGDETAVALDGIPGCGRLYPLRMHQLDCWNLMIFL